jgi:2-polyprenyl-3-methyl-5-hydroxy-6-metoxy-1,4-benzoquinol methylase
MTELTIQDYFPSNRCFNQPYSLEVQSLNSAKNDFLNLFEGGMTLRTRCPLCYHENTKFKQLAVKDYKGIPCYIGDCEECGFVFSYKHLKEECLSTNYRNYSTRIRGIDISSAESREKLFLKRAGSFAQDRFNFLSEHIQGKKSVIEIGCNDGANLYPFFKNGFSVTGFDLDEDSLNVGRKFGLDLRSSDCFDFLKNEKIDVVVLSHFLEHLIDPLSFLKALQKNLNEDGHVFVEVPGIRHFQWVNWKAGVLPYMQFEHLQCFERATLVAIMEKAGFECLKCDEFVRGVFKKSKNIKDGPIVRTEGLKYLYDVERKWNTSIKRKIYSILVKVRDAIAK